ncbi:transmembrane protein 145-like [Hydractinia symbiolongicarpus]|uniref:transmembrane protein 145-like n=1 Tax=Hydractinia symbiolongicarpus TaxID=13093 RepID=UPI00254B2302|nr:transmembrane protein 145-like [Hydractinia symbiolongicarpus]
MNYCFAIIVVFTWSIKHSSSLITEGSLKTSKENWKFLTRFCYHTSQGRVEYRFEYPASKCCQEVILYYDDQWPNVYPQESMSCKEKQDVTDPRNSQVLTLKAPYKLKNSQCVFKDEASTISCSGNRTFSSVRVRWWYLVIANCRAEDLEIKYYLSMTNGDTIWTKHFSADEKNILQTEIFFLVAFIMVISLSLLVAYELASRQLFHTTYKLYLWTVFFELLSVIVNLVYYISYGQTGKPQLAVKNIARAFHSGSDIIFVVLLILLGKGWTVTRGRISATGQVKLSLFCTFYTIAYIALFIYEAKAFDPGEVLYLYESPAGVGICILRVLAWGWFTYGIFFTLKNYVEKRLFYYPFWMFYTLWYLSGPGVVLLATYIIDAYMRAQIMIMVDRSVAFVASLFFLILTRPSAANKNFPYHVRTSQIGIVDDTDSPQNFDHRAYVPSFEEEETRRNVAALFSVNNFPHVTLNVNNNVPTNAGNYNNIPTSTDSYINNTRKPDNMGLCNFAYEEDKANTKEIPSYNDNFVAGNGHPYDLLNTSSESSSERNSTSSTGFPKLNTHKPNTVIYRSEEALSSMFMAANTHVSTSHEHVTRAAPQDETSYPKKKEDTLGALASSIPPVLSDTQSSMRSPTGQLPPLKKGSAKLPPLRGSLPKKESNA